MDMRSGNTPSLATPVTLVLMVLSVTSAGVWLTRPTRAPTEPSPFTTQASAPLPEATAAHPKANEAQPSSPFLRPLALIAKAIGPEPLFTLETAGVPALTAPYRLAIERRECDNCLSGSPAGDAGTTPALSEWRLSPDECAIVAELRDRARDQGISVGIIVATLPDWVDSNLGWMADPMLDAIQAAAAQMHYSLSGFDLVDKEPSAVEIRPKGSVWPFPKVHESTPAALLFRQDPTEPPDVGPTLLLVLLVGEAATSGIHPAAMATALDIALQWQRPFGPESKPGWWRENSVRILAPTYSGSAPSLNLALEDAVARHHLPRQDHWFKVVTGSASSPSNEPVILGKSLPHIATFGATTRSDPEELAAVARYLGRTSRDWQCGSRVGLLVEANTAWGGQVAGRQSDSVVVRQSHKLKSYCSICLKGPDNYPGSAGDRQAPFFPCAAIAHFPLHISRLRAAAQSSQATAAAPLGPRSTVAIDLGESLPPTDQIPAETPTITAATVETMMSGVFGVLRDSEVSAVGIIATDKRDH